MKKLLLIGNGGREHAIAAAIKRGSECELYAVMNARNPGIARLCKDYVVGSTTDAKLVAKYAESNRIALAVVGPETPLEAGVVDALEEKGIACAAPRQSVARLETDKAFTRQLMQKYLIRGAPAFGIFTNAKDAAAFIDTLDAPVVVKPSGLTGGKGVRVVGYHLKDNDEAKRYAKEVLSTRIGGVAKVVIEERMEGEEFTLQAFVGGELRPTPCVQDHKRAFEGDVGANTGGMGAYSDAGALLPFMTQGDYDDAFAVMRQTLSAVRAETGIEYKGFLYGQFMATADGPKLIEYNARLGDPEAMNVLSILQSDFVEALAGIAAGDVSSDVSFAKLATVCKYLVPQGYPNAPQKDKDIAISEAAVSKSGALLYYANVHEKDNALFTGTSRSIGIVGVAQTISAAERIAEAACSHVKGPLYHRRDIGTKALVEKRIVHMKKIRG